MSELMAELTSHYCSFSLNHVCIIMISDVAYNGHQCHHKGVSQTTKGLYVSTDTKLPHLFCPLKKDKPNK